MKKTLVTIAILASVFTGFAQQTIELNEWKFKTSHNLEWSKPGFDDSEWKTVKAGSPWEWQGYDVLCRLCKYELCTNRHGTLQRWYYQLGEVRREPDYQARKRLGHGCCLHIVTNTRPDQQPLVALLQRASRFGWATLADRGCGASVDGPGILGLFLYS